MKAATAAALVAVWVCGCGRDPAKAPAAKDSKPGPGADAKPGEKPAEKAETFPRDPAALKIVESAVAAHGGRERLAKVRALRSKTAEDEGDGKSTVHAVRVQFPDLVRTDATVHTGTTVTSALHRKTGWLRAGDDGEVVDYGDPDELRDRIHLIRVHLLEPLLSDESISVVPAGESTAGGRPTVGVKVDAKDLSDITLCSTRRAGCW